MTPKPGWQTTEFYITIIGKALVFAVGVGALSQARADYLGTQLGAVVAGAFAIIAIWRMVVGYVASRTAQKQTAAAGAALPGMIDKLAKTAAGAVLPFLVAALALGAMAGPASAQQQTAASVNYTACLPWRSSVERSIGDLRTAIQQQNAILQQLANRPATDPAVLAVLQQIAANQQQMLLLLAQRQQQAPVAQPLVIQTQPPAAQQAAPQHQFYQYYQGPSAPLPIAGRPLQDLSPQIPGAPRQDLSPQIPGPPRQDLTPQIPGPPRQQLPIAGPPRQDLTPQIQGAPPSQLGPQAPGTVPPISGAPQQQLAQPSPASPVTPAPPVLPQQNINPGQPMPGINGLPLMPLPASAPAQRYLPATVRR